MENNKLITREYFNNEYLSEVTMIQDDEKNVWFKVRCRYCINFRVFK